VVIGLIIAVDVGTLISLFHMEKYVEEFVMSKKDEVELDVNLNYVMSRFERHSYSFEQVFDNIKKFGYIFYLELKLIL